jgi:hypothetical protein
MALGAGCYSPTINPGAPCDTECPGDLVCIEHRCRVPGYMYGADAGQLDATDAAIDAIDGPPGDADADTINDNVDNCPAKPNLDQHDEDGDAIGDVCDPCPHLSGNAADGDSDGVGDACDPAPAVAKQRIKFFDPFTADLPEWTDESSTVSRVGETLRVNATNNYSGAVMQIANGQTRIYTGGTISSVNASASQHQITVAFGRNQAGDIYHYCEFYDTGGSQADIAISRANKGVYSSFIIQNYAGNLPIGAWSMRIDESVAAQSIGFDSKVGGTVRPTISANTAVSNPLLVTSNTMELGVNGADIRLDYFLVIETLP